MTPGLAAGCCVFGGVCGALVGCAFRRNAIFALVFPVNLLWKLAHVVPYHNPQVLPSEFDFFGLPVGSRVPAAFPGDESCEVEIIGCAPGVLRMRRDDGYVRIVY